MRLGLRTIARATMLGLAAATLASCSSVSMVASLDDIRRFMIAVRDDDQAAFDALINQPNVSHSIDFHRFVQANGLTAARNFKPAPGGEDRRLPPSAFRAIAASYGFVPGRATPPVVPIRSLSYEQVCVHERMSSKCVLIFASNPAGWKLISVPEPDRLRFE
jgi:hypothetical protein